ncbi:hypothetical protein GGD56_007327 [Rhizobium mongolense]|uniref:Uncharacterized protein n=1 Tax=Rhizobium mongolense TaxID=57676 RepID=A0ABR6IZQ0_9HYPH|nr:hypothetical protein [Rhizobium mongolense]MBB4233415.1 hypothetical protein [Rhizobium mongolense]
MDEVEGLDEDQAAELKSARRRTTRPGSIWGDTDLKALARDAVADAPDLFEPHMVSKTPGEDSELRPDASSETRLDDNAEASDSEQFSTSSVDPGQTYPLQHGDDPPFDSVQKLNDDSSKRRSPKSATRRQSASVNDGADSTRPARRERAATARAEVSFELVLLDDENRRLKGLLTEHLHQQNAQHQKDA